MQPAHQQPMKRVRPEEARINAKNAGQEKPESAQRVNQRGSIDNANHDPQIDASANRIATQHMRDFGFCDYRVPSGGGQMAHGIRA